MRDLPPRMHLKDGGYYYVKDNKWTRLSRDRTHALSMYGEIEGRQIDPKDYRVRSYAIAYLSARKNAAAREIAFDLTRAQFIALVARSRGRCEVTGITFDVRRIGRGRRPFLPSLDRIQSGGCYTVENCRLVCVAANMLLGEWGDDAAAMVAEGFVRTRRKLRDGRKILRPLEDTGT